MVNSGCDIIAISFYVFRVFNVARELSQLTNQYQPVLNKALPVRWQIRSMYGNDDPRMYPNLTLVFASFLGLPNSLRWTTSLLDYFDHANWMINHSKTLAPIVESEFVQWIWDPRKGPSPLYTYAGLQGTPHSFSIDDFSFRHNPVALDFNPKQILNSLATLNPAIAKALVIAWGYLPTEPTGQSRRDVIRETIGVGTDRWGQMAHEGLYLLAEAMDNRPERLRRNGTNMSLLEIIMRIASSEIPRVHGSINPDITRAQRAKVNIAAGSIGEDRMSLHTRAVVNYLVPLKEPPTRKIIAGNLEMSLPQVDTALNTLAANKTGSYKTMEGSIPIDSARSELISIVNDGGIRIENLSLLSEDEIYALGLLTGTNSDNYYYTTSELDHLWSSGDTSSGSRFNSYFWANRLRSRISNIRVGGLENITTDAPVSNRERSAQRFLNKFFASGRSLISGGLYEAFIQHFNRFDFQLYMSVIESLEKIIEGSNGIDLPSLITPEKVLNAPFIPSIEDINSYRKRINPRTMPGNPFSRLLRFVIHSPVLLDHMSLEEKVIIGIGLNNYMTSNQIPNYEEISLLSGNLGLTPKQVEGKIFKVLKLMRDGQINERYADTKMPFIASPRSSLIGKINSLAPREKINYLSYLGHDKAFIVGLLSSKRNGFYLTREDMTTLWYYKYGNRMLPSEDDLIRSLHSPSYPRVLDPHREAVLQQLRSKLINNVESLPIPAFTSSNSIEKVQPLLRRSATQAMLAPLVYEYMPRGGRYKPNAADYSELFQRVRMVFIEGIPIDQVTFDLLGWILHSRNGPTDKDLKDSTGYTIKMIADRSSALNALKGVFANMSLQKRERIMLRVRTMLNDK